MRYSIMQSGGSNGKRFYACSYKQKKIAVLSRPQEILHAEETDHLSSGEVGLIFSMSPGSAIKNLFNEESRARVMAVFRHPVDRLVSKFYYLQIA